MASAFRIGRRFKGICGGLATVCACVLVGRLSAGAEEEKVEASGLTVERIFGSEAFKTESWGPAQWLEDGSGYTVLEDSESAEDGKDVVRYEPASGKKTILVSATELRPSGVEQPLEVEGYTWSDDARWLLIYTNAKRVWRRNTRGDYWVFDSKTRTLRQLGGAAEPSTLMFATLSPDGEKVAYVYDNDLYVQRLANLKIKQLTSNGSDTVINGTSDWVNEEELGLRRAFRWSPDSSRLAYWQFDTSGVQRFKLVDNTSELYPRIQSFPYPKVGQTNSICRVGIVKARGGRTRWVQVAGDPRNHYLPGLEWAPDSRSIMLQQLNRLQNTNRVFRVEANSGRSRLVFVDRDDAWVDQQPNWHWLGDGDRFLWLSERDGWRHLYAVSGETGDARLLTPGSHDVTTVAGVDEARGWVYCVASPEDPTQRYLYRAALDGSGTFDRVTPSGESGTHSYVVTEDGRWAVHTFSSFGVPPRIDLVRLPGHEKVRDLADNSTLRVELAELDPGASELFRVDIGEGVQLDAWCLKPPGFDPEQRYPLLVHVYGEPAGQTVLDRWGGSNYLWHRMLAQRGYLVMSFDNRGTPAPRGRAWRKCVYRQIGILASADQAAGLRKVIEQRPYVDADRVGVWGWSGGGSMSLNAIFRYPDLYHVAMAVAFISDQRLYDTLYQERYMGLPEDNPEGFRDGSPIHFAHQLEGDLLMVYGTGDDNCHFQNCEVLINELVKQNKPFSLLTYPNRTHSIREGDGTRRHLYEALTRFLEERLPAVVEGDSPAQRQL